MFSKVGAIQTSIVVMTLVATMLSFLLMSESEGCLKKIKDFQFRSKYQREPPAELYNEQNKFPKYAQRGVSNFYVELEEDEFGGFKVIETIRLPPIMSQKRNLTEGINITLTFAADNKTEFEPGDYSSEDTKQNLTETEIEIESKVTEATQAAQEDEEPVLTDDDMLVRLEWGGECLEKHWNKCNKVKRILAPYTLANRPNITYWLDIDCFLEPILCLRNGWTANRCHIVCMSKCNRDFLIKWDSIVSHEGECPYQ